MIHLALTDWLVCYSTTVYVHINDTLIEFELLKGLLILYNCIVSHSVKSNNGFTIFDIRWS